MSSTVGATPVRPANPTRLERAAAAIVRGGVAVPGLRRFLLWRPIALGGHYLATALVSVYAWVLFGRHSVHDGLHVWSELPRWTFGRGGTTIGAAYLTHNRLGERVLRHERVHQRQWQRYGLAFPVLYLAAGKEPETNRFEVEAGLADGGYRVPRRR